MTSLTQEGKPLLSDHLPPAQNTTLTTMLDPRDVPEGKFLTPNAFPHPEYDKKQMEEVAFAHRECSRPMDYIAYYFVEFLRSSYDYCTGYVEPTSKKHQIEIANSPLRLTREKWMARFVVLESVAGIPGSVAATLRHLQALRLFQRDNAFIETLLDEAYNEKMHLLTFLKLSKPSLFTRGLLWVGQIIFATLFFIFYCIRPAICHRFVGYLEEEAVLTYTRCLEDLQLGLNPELKATPVPQIAKEYWHLPDDADFYALIEYIRADEAKHREVNHTFANLRLRKGDRNPFALQVDAGGKPQPSKTLENLRGTGWERDELIL